MKIKIYTFLGCAMFLALSGFAQTPVAYLPLDNNLNDFSGNNLHATDAGVAATEFVTDAERGDVAKFAIDAHAQFPLDPKLNFGTGDFSIGFWIKVDDGIIPGGDPSILSNKDWGSGSNPGFLIALDGADDANSHLWTSNVADGTGRLDWDADDNGTPNLVDGTWHFVVVAYDRDATMNVYFDGELKQTDPELDSKDLTIAPGDLFAANLPITIMQDGTGGYGDDFEAMLDEIYVYDRVLEAGEVTTLMESGLVSANDPALGADVYLPFDENLNDASGNGLHALDAGTSATEFIDDPERGSVAKFALDAHAQLPVDPKLAFGTNDFTVSFWINVDDALAPTGDPSILSNKDWGSGGNPGFLIALDGADDVNAHLWTSNIADGSGRLDWDADDNGTPTLVDGTWHYVAVAYDRDATMNVYFDGELKQTDPELDSKDMTMVPGDISAANLPITIMQDGTGAYGDDFEALIDEVRIWNGKALSAEEIQEAMNFQGEVDPSFGAEVYLPLDENLNDASGNSLHATDAGAESTIFENDAERGAVAKFPLAAHAQLPLDPKLDFGTDDFSVAFWIKVDDAVIPGGDPAIFSNKDWGSGGNPGMLIALDGADDATSHQWTSNFADGTGRLDWDADDNGTPGLVDGAWHFVAVSYDRDATMNVYFDGELKQTDPELDSKDLTLAPGNITAAGLPFTIMQDGTGGYGDDFEAWLDDVRVWGRVVTSAEVLTMYNFVEGGGEGEDDESYGATAYLPLDADLNDASGNNLHATDMGTVATVFVEDFERGMVAEFDAEAYAQFPESTLLDFGTEDFSLSFWVQIDPNVPVPSDPAILSNKDWGSGGNPGFIVALDNADDPTSHQWTVNVADGNERLDWDADDNSAPGLKDGAWHFVAVAFDRDATMNVYIDGELKQSDPELDSKDMTLIPGNLSAPGLPLTIMQDATGAYGADFKALLDDIRIWKGKVITPQEVAEIYSPEDKAYDADVFLTFNKNLNDFSGNGVHAVDAGTEATEFVKDPDRGDVAFFPVAAHAQFPLDPLLDFGTNDFSLAFWIIIDPSIPIGGDPSILSNKDWGSGGNPGFLIALDGADDPTSHMWTVNVADGTGRLDWDADDNGAANLKDGAWHLVAATFDRDDKLNVYLDGALYQSDPAQDSYDMSLVPGSLSAAALPLTIMQDGTGGYGDDFSALMDNLRVWNRVITSNEVADIYAEDKGNGSGEEGEIVLDTPERPEFESFLKVYPNPVNSNQAYINYALETPAQVKISIFDKVGHRMETIVNQRELAGNHTVVWNPVAYKPGLYYLRFEGTNIKKTHKVFIVK